MAVESFLERRVGTCNVSPSSFVDHFRQGCPLWEEDHEMPQVRGGYIYRIGGKGTYIWRMKQISGGSVRV